MAAPWDDPRIARGMAVQLAARRARVAAGDAPLGWKVGFGAPAAMEKFKTTAPLVGYLMQSGALTSGATASLKGWAKPVAEPEIAVVIGHDLAPGGNRAAAAEAIAALAPAIELADADLPFDDPEAILKANIFQRHVVLGLRDSARAGGKVAGLTGRLFRRGVEAGRTEDPQALIGDIIQIVRHVADLLGACGERLAAGHVIITGSILPPVLVEPDESEFRFELEPIGAVSVRFAR